MPSKLGDCFLLQLELQFANEECGSDRSIEIFEK